ncbi:MAG TPA: hypothetical protein VNB90_09575 [Cytophagaceae bacterium]|nr:hypothetical protein [Cytophagaceae bacterium]
MKKIVFITAMIVGLLVSSNNMFARPRGHKAYVRHSKHHKTHVMHKAHGRVDATYQN